jgi:hypothetical protein
VLAPATDAGNDSIKLLERCGLVAAVVVQVFRTRFPASRCLGLLVMQLDTGSEWEIRRRHPRFVVPSCFKAGLWTCHLSFFVSFTFAVQFNCNLDD